MVFSWWSIFPKELKLQSYIQVSMSEGVLWIRESEIFAEQGKI